MITSDCPDVPKRQVFQNTVTYTNAKLLTSKFHQTVGLKVFKIPLQPYSSHSEIYIYSYSSYFEQGEIMYMQQVIGCIQ